MIILVNFVTGQYSTLVCKDRASYKKGKKLRRKIKPSSFFYVAA